ncbi:GTP 3',8-cyclase MoaA [Desulfurispirillum indicum]|uniref:GTP 3',8-cyclase n=1 Tax=Desulfurispirillum indicum (strain ATCC BAA-1389 / DSM 22839 / S5) TaxID=653733 RepID=E6W5C5_DESIS|nr:GTP 3',8-cyclase MoaA [Desulfurispirillum indicum]ADU64856.1 molybdenum cofactor biosynthesis protein A [Desulfurispirillum indicum S5]UCZ56787.1 GTP 3',8-cyclase MoaA [Desulfurispirillum indicum]
MTQQLLDSQGNPITYVRISVTDRCNLKCFYCVPEDGICHATKDQLLTPEEIIRVLNLLHGLGVSKVRITGGEPLARRGIGKLIRQISAIGFSDIAMTTNGVLLPRFAGLLRECGLKRVNISLDSLHPERFASITGVDSFEQVWKGIQAAQENGLVPIKINAVAIRGINDDEIADFVALTEHEDISVRFIEYMPVGIRDRYNTDQLVSVAEMLSQVKNRFSIEPLDQERYSTARMFRIVGGRGTFGFISPMTEHFCHTCNRLRITADGKIKTCLFSKQEHDFLPMLRQQNCSDAELRAYFLQVAGGKVTEIDDMYRGSRNMTRIGG